MKPRYEINAFPWGKPAVLPASFAVLSFEESGMQVGLCTDERNPRGTVTRPNGLVLCILGK